MRDVFETALVVLNWRSRSLWMMVCFLIMTTIFGHIAANALENMMHSDVNQSAMFISILRPLLENVYLIFFALSIIIPLRVFYTDWKAFHKTW